MQALVLSRQKRKSTSKFFQGRAFHRAFHFVYFYELSKKKLNQGVSLHTDVARFNREELKSQIAAL
jgi:hypothetical protein